MEVLRNRLNIPNRSAVRWKKIRPHRSLHLSCECIYTYVYILSIYVFLILTVAIASPFSRFVVARLKHGL